VRGWRKVEWCGKENEAGGGRGQKKKKIKKKFVCT